MKELSLPSQEYLNELFTYNPETGTLTRKKTVRSNAKEGQIIKSKTGDGYYRVSVDNVSYKIHRLIWKMYYGEDPADLQIDHINRDRTDNRIINLRVSTSQEQKFNQSIRLDNNSGFKGVYRPKGRRKWTSRIKKDGKSIHLGTFDTPEEASFAYQSKALELFGEFYSAGSD